METTKLSFDLELNPEIVARALYHEILMGLHETDADATMAELLKAFFSKVSESRAIEITWQRVNIWLKQFDYNCPYNKVSETMPNLYAECLTWVQNNVKNYQY